MAKTDLERALSEPGREEKIQEIKKTIEKEGIRFVYFQHVSVTGRAVGKGASAEVFESIARRGYQLVYGSVANLYMDRYGNYIGFGAEESELVGLPDLDTFRILPWERRVARVLCDCYDTETGEAFDADCRGNLKRLMSQVERETGYTFYFGIEPEMMWLRRADDGRITGPTKPNCYHIAQFEQLRPIIMDVIEYAKGMGLQMIYGDHEDAPGQLELNIRHDTPLRTADNHTTYRQICGEVARRHGLVACFMPKPFLGVSANGHHHHMSVVDSGGKMAFYDDAKPAKLSDFGRHFIGGILAHADALCAITASTVNSYKRFWDTGYWAPLYKTYGWQNRTSLVRVAAPGRLEYRAVDAAVNPYLSIPAIVIAGLDGVKNKIDPGEPSQENVYEIFGREKHAGAQEGLPPKIPLSLGEALEALKRDEVVKRALPGRMYKVFLHYKMDEWERFLSHVCDWDIERYLDVLP